MIIVDNYANIDGCSERILSASRRVSPHLTFINFRLDNLLNSLGIGLQWLSHTIIISNNKENGGENNHNIGNNEDKGDGDSEGNVILTNRERWGWTVFCGNTLLEKQVKKELENWYLYGKNDKNDVKEKEKEKEKEEKNYLLEAVIDDKGNFDGTIIYQYSLTSRGMISAIINEGRHNAAAVFNYSYKTPWTALDCSYTTHQHYSAFTFLHRISKYELSDMGLNIIAKQYNNSNYNNNNNNQSNFLLPVIVIPLLKSLRQLDIDVGGEVVYSGKNKSPSFSAAMRIKTKEYPMPIATIGTTNDQNLVIRKRDRNVSSIVAHINAMGYLSLSYSLINDIIGIGTTCNYNYNIYSSASNVNAGVKYIIPFTSTVVATQISSDGSISSSLQSKIELFKYLKCKFALTHYTQNPSKRDHSFGFSLSISSVNSGHNQPNTGPISNLIYV